MIYFSLALNHKSWLRNRCCTNCPSQPLFFKVVSITFTLHSLRGILSGNLMWYYVCNDLYPQCTIGYGIWENLIFPWRNKGRKELRTNQIMNETKIHHCFLAHLNCICSTSLKLYHCEISTTYRSYFFPYNNCHPILNFYSSQQTGTLNYDATLQNH